MAKDDSNWKRVADLLEYDIGETLKIIVTVNENVNDGHRMIDVRQFWRHRAKNEWFPAKRGISLPLDEWGTVIAIIQGWLDDNT